MKTLVARTQPKGGSLTKAAVMLCKSAAFRLYLDRRTRHKYSLQEWQLPDCTHNEQDAKEFILKACGIASRAELDHNLRAAKTFKYIQRLFSQYQRRLNQR